MRTLLFSVVLTCMSAFTSLAQNCSINAGLNSTICLSDSLKLYGTRSGLFSANASCRWSQISGNPVIIERPDSLVTKVIGYTAGTYAFKLSNKCQDGIISEDTVTVTVLGTTIANAGNDTILCPAEPYRLQGNSPLSGETGLWTIIAGTNAITIQDPASPNSSISLNANNPGLIRLRWTIKNILGCVSYDDVVITNRGGVAPVNAGNDQVLDNCYTTTTCTKLIATNGGTGFGNQIGIWSFISGPAVPIMNTVNTPAITVCNLVTGVYTFRYTVTGPCANGFDEVKVTVPPASQNLSLVSAGFNSSICDGATTDILVGSVPTSAGEVVHWTQLSGPVQAQILTPDNPSSLVTGLTQPGGYLFSYTVTNSQSGCSGSTTKWITKYEVGNLDAGPDQILPCNVTETTIPVRVTGRGYLSYRIVSGPTGAFTYPTIFTDNNYIKNLNYPGTYRVEVLYQFGPDCPVKTDYVDITVSRTPTGSNAGTSQNFPCAAASTQLAGNNPVLTGYGSGFWSQISGPSQADLLTPSNYLCTIANNTLPGAYVFRWTVSGGNACPDSHDDIRVVISGTTVTRSNAGLDKIVCADAPVVLEGNSFRADETGTWSATPATGIVFYPNNRVATPYVTGLRSNTLYTFVYTIANSCGNTSTDTTFIQTGDLNGPTVANAGSNQCLQAGTTSAILYGNTPTSGTGKWRKLSGPSCNITPPEAPVTKVTGMTNGTYVFEWAITVAGCDNTSADTTIVTIGDQTTIADAGPDAKVCGSSIVLNANTPSIGTGVWSQISGDGNAVITAPEQSTTTVEHVSTGLYTFRWTIFNGACTSTSDDVVVNISTPPSAANAGLDKNICTNATNTTVQLDAVLPSRGNGEWVWITGPATNVVFTDSRDPKTNVTGLVNGKYTFGWIVKAGANCPASIDEVTVTVSSAANAGADKNLCNMTSTLIRGNIGSTGIWTQVSGPAATISQIPVGNPNANISGLQPNASYTFRYTINASGGCPSTYDDVVINNGSPSMNPDAGRDEIYCNSNIFSLQGSAPKAGESGVWSVISGPAGASFSPSATTSNASLNNVKTGIYILQWTISNGACSLSDIKRIENNPAPTAANAGPDDTICGETYVTMQANMPVNGIGKWTQVSGPSKAIIDAPNQPGSRIYGLVAGNYTFRWTISSPSCPENFDDVNIYKLDAVPNALAGNDIIVCGDSIILTAHNAAGRLACSWHQLSGPSTAHFSSPNQNICTVTGLRAGVYSFTWTLSNSKCESTDTISVNVLSTVQVDAGKDIHLCNNIGSIQLSDAIVSGYTTEGTWNIVSGKGTLSNNGLTTFPQNVLFTPEEGYTGAVVLQLTANDDCHTVTDQKTIWVENGKAQLQANNDTVYTSLDKPVTIAVLKNDWSFAGNELHLCMDNAIQTTPVHGNVTVQLDGSISYRPAAGFSGIDSFQYRICTDKIADSLRYQCFTDGNTTAWVYVTIGDCIIPNVFTPNGDGVNDYFDIPCARGNAQISIFNRWGIEVYKSDAYMNDWNGAYNGEALPDGTYFYMLSYNNETSSKINKNGFITLRR